MRILLATPPMTQLNSPYAATPALAGHLRARGWKDVYQRDWSLELGLKIFSRAGLARVASRMREPRWFLADLDRHLSTIDAAIAYLQGRDPGLAPAICRGGFFPEGPRSRAYERLDTTFGALGTGDEAKHLASLFLDDVSDAIREGADPRFTLARYCEKLAASQPTFDPILEALGGPPTVIDLLYDELVEADLREYRPDLIALTVPFPGNVYGAFRAAKVARRVLPATRIALGGGYVNTELRQLADPRVFDLVDFVCYDDGEAPLERIAERVAEGMRGGNGRVELIRTRCLDERGGIELHAPDAREKWAPACPSYEGLDLGRYLSLVERLNPMHRLWSDGRWLKLTLAHGCYWKRCVFCDVTLDYIARFEPRAAGAICDQMERLVAETGIHSFHFTDEAAPPALLRALSREILRRGLAVSWWGNIRFEAAFDPALAAELARAGCVAVTGGLEAASDRLLERMDKGVTVAQAARAASALASSGILVHAYLIHGFPGQTTQEAIDALERVRQLFAAGCLHSAYWHRFSATAHSLVGHDPGAYGIRVHEKIQATFARNDLPFEEPGAPDWTHLSSGLEVAVYNFMNGVGLEKPVDAWFPGSVPRTRVAPDLIQACLIDRRPPTRLRSRKGRKGTKRERPQTNSRRGR